jgi:hypothetical protein
MAQTASQAAVYAKGLTPCSPLKIMYACFLPSQTCYMTRTSNHLCDHSCNGAEYRPYSYSPCGICSFMLHALHPYFRAHSVLVLPTVTQTDLTSVPTTILAPWIGPVSNKCTKHAEKSLPLLLEPCTQLNRIGISRETERRTRGSGVLRLASTFLWLGSRNCGWRQGRTGRSLLQPMFRRQLCS